MASDELFRQIFFALFALGAGVRAYYTLRTKRPLTDWRAMAREEGTAGVLAMLLSGIAIMLLVALYAAYPQGIAWSALALPEWLRWLSALAAGASIVLLAWTHRELGAHWSIELKKPKTLVTTGPYRRVRHPMHATSYGFFLGLSLVSANGLLILATLATLALFYRRLDREEALLIREFGNEYREYMKRTGRLLPRL